MSTVIGHWTAKIPAVLIAISLLFKRILSNFSAMDPSVSVGVPASAILVFPAFVDVDGVMPFKRGPGQILPFFYFFRVCVAYRNLDRKKKTSCFLPVGLRSAKRRFVMFVGQSSAEILDYSDYRPMFEQMQLGKLFKPKNTIQAVREIMR